MDIKHILLHWAAFNGRLDTVKYLVEQKDVNINQANKYGSTALHWAAFNGHLDTVKYLIEQKSVDIDQSNKNGSTALHLAVFNNHLNTVRYLVEQRNVDVNQANKNGSTALHWGAFNGHLDTIKYLVGQKNADVNQVNKHGITALHWAIFHGHLDTVKYLVEQKDVNINQANKYGSTALHWATKLNNTDIMDILLEKGAEVNLQNKNGYTPLYTAIEYCHTEVAKSLVANEVKLRGFDIEKPNYLVQHHSDFAKEMSEYWDKCLDEVKRMKEEKIDQGITFYDVLISKGDKLASYMKNKNIKKRLEAGNYKTEFPLYANKIQSQYKKGKERAVLLDKGEDSIIKIVDIGCGKHLPKISSVSEKIVRYLTNDDDIENLNKAAENLSKGIKRKALFEEDKSSAKYFAVSKVERCSSSLSDTKIESLCQARSIEN